MLAIQDALTVIRALIERCNQLGFPIHQTIVAVGGTALAAHGIRPESEDVDLPRYADEFARQLEKHYALAPSRSLPELKLPKFMLEMLWQAYYPEREEPPPSDPLTPEPPPPPPRANPSR